MEEKRILVVGPNPAYQRYLQFPQVNLNDINRATKLVVGLGGRGSLFAKALSVYKPGIPILAQFIGGYTGEYIQKQLSSYGIEQINVKTESETRICTTLLCRHSKQTTEVIDPSSSVTPEEVSELEEKIYGVLEKVIGIALCGTFPLGLPSSFYAKIVQRKKENTIVFLEGYAASCIKKALQTKEITIIKVKKKELGILTDTTVLMEGATQLISDYNIKFVCILSKFIHKEAHLFTYSYEHYEFKPPSLDSQLVNPIGSGAVFSAIFFASMMESNDVVSSFKYAMACGCARALEMQPDSYCVEIAADLVTKIEVKKWS